MLRIFNVGKAFTRQHEQAQESAQLRHEAESYDLAGEGGYMTVLKCLLFTLFAYYNARLFIVTVPGWEGWLTAVFALLGEATALYCLRNYTRSAGAHKRALGVFGAVLTLFSAGHATVSLFRMERGKLSGPVQFYAEHIAFPLLFGLLLLAAVIIPLCHWRKRVAQEQATAQVEIARGRARLVGQSAALRDENLLEHERLEHLRERIRLGNEYVAELESFAKLKQREHEALARITDPDVRREVADALGLKLDQTPQFQPAASARLSANKAELNGHVNALSGGLSPNS